MLVIEKEKRKQMALEAKRRAMEERCRRIHDPKWTFMGLDVEALNAQIEERRQREAEECKKNEYFEKMRLDFYEQAVEMEKQQKELKKNEMKEINEFRCTQQAPHTRATFDLNDPKQYKEAVPRSDDPCLTISSAQKFIGEDPNGDERRREQRCQFRSWLDQQVFEHRAAAKQREFEEQQYKEISDRINQRADEKEKIQQQMKSEIESDIRKFNKELAAETAKRRCEEKKDMEKGGWEMHSCYLGPALTEDRGVPRSSGGWRNVVMDMYKGMGPEEKAKYREEQLKQIKEQSEKKAKEAAVDAAWNAGYEQIYKTAYAKEQEECKKKAEMELHIREQNRILAAEQNHRRFCEDNYLYKFLPTEEYFSKFGSSP